MSGDGGKTLVKKLKERKGDNIPTVYRGAYIYNLRF